ncbi:hypothetical protein [Longimicrobium sp.]|uniref:hypothetical protein n=1 Tax=Longimicrobium sp. TaxID=2029185 RepID=UPI002D7E9606|nr:hypothetical protein [Longimicrobium sp.]
MMIQREAHSPGVLVRDFLLFGLKLLIDSLKDILLVQVAILAFCVDMIFMLLAGSRRSFFYTVLELGERFDLWLNLYAPARGAGDNPDGLFGESRAGDATFLGEMEELARRGPEPPIRPAATGIRR